MPNKVSINIISAALLVNVMRFYSNSRSVTPVVGTILIVALVVIIAASIGFVSLGFADDISSEPQFSSVSLEAVGVQGPGSNSVGNGSHIRIPNADQCEYYHTVIVLEHNGGNNFDSEDLEYDIELSNDDDTLRGTFNDSVSNPGVTAQAGDQILIALDSNVGVTGNEDFEGGTDCGESGGSSDSRSAVLFGDKNAWNPSDAGSVGELFDIADTFLDGEDHSIDEVSVRIRHMPSNTILVETETSNVIVVDEYEEDEPRTALFP